MSFEEFRQQLAKEKEENAKEGLLTHVRGALEKAAEASREVADAFWFMAFWEWKRVGELWKAAADDATLLGEQAVSINMLERSIEAYRCAAECDERSRCEETRKEPLVVPIPKNEPLVYCPLCEKLVSGKLVDHHWFEAPTKQEVSQGVAPSERFFHGSPVCVSCNSSVGSGKHLWNGEWTERDKAWMDHVLPNFELQKLYIREGKSEGYFRKLKETYDFPLQPPRSERGVEREIVNA